ncbi:type III-A CRISPR-associated RAMP protein Csm4 [Thermoflexus sp.]|uniref:type III-A CRISPR-associated RAMP protein Csm4 n=1 Tax=Thermoflexus sp. TaxID=1969742 RepID=UPI002ADE3D44|nr:type III-A CRISPR-associated RAMP protein Csm4 [Thermoflexus sp.]
MREEIVYLDPRGAFHLGERGIGLEETAPFLHADTLYAALGTAWAMLFGEGARQAELFGPEPPVLISSAFPFAGPVRFYPRPYLPARELPPDRSLKDVAFVSEELLRRMLEGAPVGEVESIHEGTAWLTPEEAEGLRAAFRLRALEGERFWARGRIPRVTLDLLTQTSSLWHFGRLVFREPGPEPTARAGLFFRVRYRRPELADRFRAAVRLLGDTGIGGDRSAGHGLFDPRFEPAEPLGDPEAGAFVTLSPVYPPREQAPRLLGPGARYGWLTRGGWIGGRLAAPYRRRTVRMFAEGSALTGDPQGLWGALADVTPLETPEPLPHRIYRYGFAFPVGAAALGGGPAGSG